MRFPIVTEDVLLTVYEIFSLVEVENRHFLDESYPAKTRWTGLCRENFKILTSTVFD